MTTKKLTATVLTFAAAGLVLASPGHAAADPGSPCAQGRPCASVPNCPTAEQALPAGPHAQAVPADHGGQQCTTVTITPKPGIVQARPVRVGI